MPALTKEQKELTKLLGSDKLKSERLIEEMKAIDAKFGAQDRAGQAPHRNRQGGRSGGDVRAGRRGRGTAPTAVEKRTHHRRLLGTRAGCARSRAIRNSRSDDKYREGDRARFWIHAQTTDQLMLLATDGRFFTLDCSKLPGGRGNGEAIRSFIDLPPEADIATMFVHVPGRKLLLAATSGHGFITNEDDAVAMTKNGKRVMNVKPGVEAAVCRPAEGDHVAVVGENRKLLIFPLAEVPEMARGQGVFLQRYKDGGLTDAAAFTWKDGLKDENGRLFEPSELKDWRGERAQAGRIVPRGWARGRKIRRQLSCCLVNHGAKKGLCQNGTVRVAFAIVAGGCVLSGVMSSSASGSVLSRLGVGLCHGRDRWWRIPSLREIMVRGTARLGADGRRRLAQPVADAGSAGCRARICTWRHARQPQVVRAA